MLGDLDERASLPTPPHPVGTDSAKVHLPVRISAGGKTVSVLVRVDLHPSLYEVLSSLMGKKGHTVSEVFERILEEWCMDHQAELPALVSLEVVERLLALQCAPQEGDGN